MFTPSFRQIGLSALAFAGIAFCGADAQADHPRCGSSTTVYYGGSAPNYDQTRVVYLEREPYYEPVYYSRHHVVTRHLRHAGHHVRHRLRSAGRHIRHRLHQGLSYIRHGDRRHRGFSFGGHRGHSFGHRFGHRSRHGLGHGSRHGFGRGHRGRHR